MAINRFMKPAEQPLLDTYVPLPFKELALAYASRQKEHNEGETLASELDDDLLKIRASRPRDVDVLSTYRKDLDQQVEDLYKKHNGKYADMIPDLKLMKKQLDKDLQSGDLYSIKKSTKQYKKLQEQITKAQSKGDYDIEFNPFLSGESEFQNWYMEGIYYDEETQSYKLDETGGWSTDASGTSVLNKYLYSGIHPKVDDIEIAHTIFNPIKADMYKFSKESFIDPNDPGKGTVTQSGESRRIDLAKIYKAAYDNVDQVPGPFKEELALVTRGWLSDKQNLQAAKNVIDNIYGDPPAEIDDGSGNLIPNPQVAAKQEAIDGLTEEVDGETVLTNQAYKLSEANYIAQLGEKYLMNEQTTGIDYQNIDKKGNSNRNAYKDFKSIIQGQTVLRHVGAPNDVGGGGPIYDYDDSANQNQIRIESLYKKMVEVTAERDNVFANYDLDNEQKDEWDQKVTDHTYQYKAAAFAQQNLFQMAAKSPSLQLRKLSNGSYYYYDEDGISQALGPNDPLVQTYGFNLIEFGDDGYPVDVVESNLHKRSDEPYSGQDFSDGFWDFLQNSENPQFSPLFITAENMAEDLNWFKGRDYTQPLSQTSMDPKIDEELYHVMQNKWLQEDFHFYDDNGDRKSLAMLDDENKINGTAVTELLASGDVPIMWTLTPSALVSDYEGTINVPGKEAGETVSLFFKAPAEFRETLWSVKQTVDDQGYKVFRPTTTAEKMNLQSMFVGQLDLARALTIAGNTARSYAVDGEGNPLGYYFFGQLPDGTPIENEEFVFSPVEGLIKDINSDGSYEYTTGNELFNVTSYVDDIGRIVTLNDPTYSSTAAHWRNNITQSQVSLPNAQFDRVLTTSSNAFVTDNTGTSYNTELRKGQVLLGGIRVDDPGAAIMGNGKYKGLNAQFATQLVTASKDLIGIQDLLTTKVKSSIENNAKLINAQVTFTDGTVMKLSEALNNNDIYVRPMTFSYGDANIAAFPINNGVRSYDGQMRKYEAWVAGGKTGPPVANPDIGGFHVMGQAIDLSQDKSSYDWYLEAADGNGFVISDYNDRTTTTDKTNSISLSSNNNSDTKFSTNGVLLSTLMIGGEKPLGDSFLQEVVDSYINILNGSSSGASPDMGTVVIRQYDDEWWHFSAGEFGRTTPAVYPSW